MAKSTSCLQSSKLVRRLDREERRDERRAGVGRERPEHPRHLDALAVDDDDRNPQERGEAEENPRGGDRELRRRREREQRDIGRAFEAGHAVWRRVRRQSGSDVHEWVRTSACACASVRSAAAMHRLRIDARQAAEITGRADALLARAARQALDLHRCGRDARIPPRRRPRRQRRTVDPDDRRSRGRRDVQRSAVPADEEDAPLDQRA